MVPFGVKGFVWSECGIFVWDCVSWSYTLVSAPNPNRCSILIVFSFDAGPLDDAGLMEAFGLGLDGNLYLS